MAKALYDMHCHLGFAANAAMIPALAVAANIHAFSCTVTPKEFAEHAPEPASPILWGLGLHPWYVQEDWPMQVAAFKGQLEQLLANNKAHCVPLAIGEIGLDFSEKHRATANWQVAALTQLLSGITEAAHNASAPPLLSLHAVHSVTEALELLQKSGALECCQIIFHWFSGSGEELAAARKAGCFFSVGPHMLASRRGRAYGAQIPERQLLLETDEPPEGIIMNGETWRGQLQSALDQLAQLRKTDGDHLAAVIAATSSQLLYLPTKV